MKRELLQRLPLRRRVEHSCLHIIPGTTSSSSSFCLALIRSGFLDMLDRRMGLGEGRECVWERWGQDACGFTQWVTAFPILLAWNRRQEQPQELVQGNNTPRRGSGTFNSLCLFFMGRIFFHNKSGPLPTSSLCCFPAGSWTTKKLRGPWQWNWTQEPRESTCRAAQPCEALCGGCLQVTAASPAVLQSPRPANKVFWLFLHDNQVKPLLGCMPGLWHSLFFSLKTSTGWVALKGEHAREKQKASKCWKMSFVPVLFYYRVSS